MKRLRIAVIGCGGISRVHVASLLLDKRVEITHLVDTSSKQIEGFKQRFPALARLPDRSRDQESRGQA